MKIAVIPARGGSKRIPRKNIRPFAGKPLIAYAIDAARLSGVFDLVLVSTDDDEIAEIARQYGASVPFRRPVELSDDTTSTTPVVQHAIRRLAEDGRVASHVCCIYPGVPLLNPQDIARAYDQLMAAGGEGYCFPVVAYASPIQRALRRDAANRAAPFDPSQVQTRTQDLEHAYFDAGQFYWGSLATWTEGRSPHLGGYTLVLPDWQAIDIDTPEDWGRAERIFGSILAGGK